MRHQRNGQKIRRLRRGMMALGVLSGIIAFSPNAFTQNDSAETSNALNTQQEAQTYDAVLAQSLGADAYGMKHYVFVILHTGPNDTKIMDKQERSQIFRGHFSSMAALAESGKLVMAGPFIEGGDKRGLYIYNVSTIEAAKALVMQDPAVAAGIFTPEFTRYYGSAALQQINGIHRHIQKRQVE